MHHAPHTIYHAPCTMHHAPCTIHKKAPASCGPSPQCITRIAAVSHCGCLGMLNGLFLKALAILIHHQPSEWDQIAFFSSLAFQWSSPDSSDLWYKSRQLKKTVCPPLSGLWMAGVQAPAWCQHWYHVGTSYLSHSLSPSVSLPLSLSLYHTYTHTLTLSLSMTAGDAVRGRDPINFDPKSGFRV